MSIKEEFVGKIAKQISKVFGTENSSVGAVRFATSFYLNKKYYEQLQDRGYSDVEGATFLILLTATQTFLSCFDMISGIHHIECTEYPQIADLAPLARRVQQSMEEFLHIAITDTIMNSRRLEEKFDWNPEVLPHIESLSWEMYNNNIDKLKVIGHDCSHCHIYDNKKGCEIWNAIPKPIGFTEDVE